MDQPSLIERNVAQPSPELSMRAVEYLLSGIALVAAVLLNFAH
ncbi:MAG: hypothetical protein ABIV26_02835 [Candidatus Limnocylindrales bacterium]